MQEVKKIICVTPVYNDWDSFTVLIIELAQVFKTLPNYTLQIIAVDDGSSQEAEYPINLLPTKILKLKTNIGHQRAIAVGLQYVYNEEKGYNYVVVLDSDGEDVPFHIPLLLEKVEKENFKKIIFAERNKRQESVYFKLGYFFYKRIFHFLTGQKISFGNFSVIPNQLLGRVVHQSNIWNHYSGGIIQSKISFDKILLDRGKRYKGVSKMNFNNLILHGLSSIAVYFDYLSLKILRYSLYGIFICAISVGIVLFKKFVTDSAIPGWASSLILIISGIILQLFSVTLIVLLMQLSSRKNITAPNSKIYKDFIEGIK